MAQVNRELAKDPDNAELISLRDELANLLTMIQDLQGAGVQPEPSSSKASTSKHSSSKNAAAHTETSKAVTVELKAGENVMARYSDGKFYPARIISVGGSKEDSVYTVQFDGYDATELVVGTDIKAMTDSKKRALQTEADIEKEKKKRKNEKKAETKAVKTAEQMGKQQAWQKFASKSSKKGMSRPFQN